MGIVFLLLIIFTICQRLYELKISSRNIAYIVSKGGFVVKEVNYLFMVLLHSSWLLVLLFFAVEHFSLDFRQSLDVLEILGLVLFISGQIIRIHAIKTLGYRWTTKIAISSEQFVIKKGMYKYIRHPNYVGVSFEIIGLPLVGGLLGVGIIYSVLNFIILYFRIRLEEKYLDKYNYGECNNP
jgi:methyltransferase